MGKTRNQTLQHYALFALALVLPALALAACIDGPPTPTPSPTASAYPSPTSKTPTVPAPPTPSPTPVPGLSFLESLQDTQRSGLVQIRAGAANTITTAYVNAAVAIAFTAEQEYERARRIFNVFSSHPDLCPTITCTCPGGYPQYWDAATGEPITAGRNDIWVGDNAWLLVALKYYRQATGDPQYEGLTQQMVHWFDCLYRQTPPPGIYAGFQSNGEFIQNSVGRPSKHAEGSIDTYGALRDMGKEPMRSSIKTWLDQNVWVPEGDCFQRGPDNKASLPLDHVSWGVLSLGVENSRYACILPYAEALLARRQDRYLIEAFDRNAHEGEDESQWYWSYDESGGCRLDSIGRDLSGNVPGLRIAYSCPPHGKWFRIFRSRDIALTVTNGFRYFFRLKGDGTNNRLEVKLTNQTGEVYSHALLMDSIGWEEVTLGYDQFEYWNGTGTGNRLGEIGQVEFAVRNDSAFTTTGEFWLSPIRYADDGGPDLLPTDGLAAFEPEQNWLWIPGTAQMAAAYHYAGHAGMWQHYLGELTDLFQAIDRGGLPYYLTGGINRPEPDAEATAWYIIAAHGLNPFDP